jgi:hypothetical protein
VELYKIIPPKSRDSPPDLRGLRSYEKGFSSKPKCGKLYYADLRIKGGKSFL